MQLWTSNRLNSRSPGVCYSYSGQGNISRAHQDNRIGKCYCCGERGHIARVCPQEVENCADTIPMISKDSDIVMFSDREYMPFPQKPQFQLQYEHRYPNREQEEVNDEPQYFDQRGPRTQEGRRVCHDGTIANDFWNCEKCPNKWKNNIENCSQKCRWIFLFFWLVRW